MLQIGALNEIKREIASMRNLLVKILVAEVEKCVYEDLAWRMDEVGGQHSAFTSYASTAKSHPAPMSHSSTPQPHRGDSPVCPSAFP